MCSSDLGALNSLVMAIALSGTDVYAGGFFTNAAGIPEADFVARYEDGSTVSLATLTLSTSDDRVKAGETVVLRARATGDGELPTGKVVFRVGTRKGKQLGTCTLNANGRCRITTDRIPAGTRHIWARYGGDGTYAAVTAKLLMS